eukprot:TRINITY_DN178_c0_g1_i1.p1 TRINITY_DN178_c0_g1~~TRINITY_DN178_c0_g1_i1.p1  ORF type:complete len:106 (-),score=14.78 TRINITY_DN178_c0_g1_i1:27-344(-)
MLVFVYSIDTYQYYYSYFPLLFLYCLSMVIYRRKVNNLINQELLQENMAYSGYGVQFTLTRRYWTGRGVLLITINGGTATVPHYQPAPAYVTKVVPTNTPGYSVV